MSAREDLAGLIWTTSREDEGTISGIGAGYIADVLLAAGWRPPARVIETVEELEALATGSVLIDRQGLVHKGAAVQKYSRFILRRFGPLTLLWEPGDDNE